MKGLVFVLCAIILFLKDMSTASKCLNNPRQTLDEVIGCIKYDYDKIHMPNRTEGKPLLITADIVVISMGSLNDVEMDYTLEFYLRQRWIDPLLRYNPNSLAKNATSAILHQTLIDRLWRPDTYIENMKSVKFNYVDSPFVSQGFRLFPNGMILISSRISATFSCHMKFYNFPMDKQLCPFLMSSYFLSEDVLYYKWGEVSFFEGSRHNNQFDILGVVSERKSLVYTTGVYSCLKATFKFRRRVQRFMLGFYIPSILIVMLSWVSFYISPNSAPARCALGIITVLAIGGFFTGQRSSFPVVSYVMAIDLFILVCYVFVFLALLEYAAVHYFFVYEVQLKQMKRKNKIPNAKTNEVNINDEGEFEPEEEDDDNTTSKTMQTANPVITHSPNSKVLPLPSAEADGLRKKTRICKPVQIILTLPCKLYRAVEADALIIDNIARVAFPLAFFLFNAVYWAYYIVQHYKD